MMSTTKVVERSLVACAIALVAACSAQGQSSGPSARAQTLTAQAHDSSFPPGHDTYNGISTASDGRIYYVLSTDVYDVGASVFVFDPPSGSVKSLGDLTEACGEKGKAFVCQGKSHVGFVEADGKLFFATHIGYYSIIDGMEKMGIPPEGYKPYPGGHLLSYDLKTGAFQNLAVEPHQEGILAMTMDPERGHIFGLTWPSGRFFRFEVANRDWKDFGPVCQQGEDGKGPTYRTICRSIVVDPGDGSAYFTDSEGAIHRYSVQTDEVQKITTDNLVKDYFGLYDPTSAGHMGYNWRQVAWHPDSKAVYGVHGNSGYLFRFLPERQQVQLLDRITSKPSQRTGMFDQFSYGYLGFNLGPNRNTLYYLTGGPVFADGKRVAGKTSTAMGESKGIENLHLVTYHIPTERYTDHGPIFFADGSRPSYVNSIAIGHDGTVYALSRIPSISRDKPRTDLISISSDQIKLSSP